MSEGPSNAERRAAYAAEARARAEALYAGVLTPHRSCGIALAETFGLPTPSYQALRKGGLTGAGPCGAIAAGLLVLGELLGDPSPTGPPTDALKEAAGRYREAIAAKIDLAVDTACNDRTARFPTFASPARLAYCTSLAAVVAETVAEVLWDAGAAHGHVPPAVPPAPWGSTG
ncbi:MAG: hypothetical protein Q8P18_00495 [Pseudomonadota bacterium]|nr:hypothetical protein [Pseudomonadota bacterium]